MQFALEVEGLEGRWQQGQQLMTEREVTTELQLKQRKWG